MKKIFIFFAIIVLGGILTIILRGDPLGLAQVNKPFGEVLSLAIGEKLHMADDLTIELTQITDSRCPVGVQCIWAGELAGYFKVIGGALGKNASEIILSTFTHPTATVDPYVFTLDQAEVEKISFIVSKS